MKLPRLVVPLLGLAVSFALLAQPAGADDPAGVFLMTVDTDKSVYQLGEDVNILYRLENASQSTIDVAYGYLDWNIYAYANPGNLTPWELLTTQERLWSAVDRPFPGEPLGSAVSDETLSSAPLDPWEVRELYVLWDLTHSGGDPVDPGEYELIGGFGGVIIPTGVDWDVSGFQQHITVVPEPATAMTLLAAVGLLIRRKRRPTRPN